VEPLTPTGNVIRNVEVLRKLRGLNQEVIASRMAILGFSWYRKTVHRFIGGERPIRLDELYALMLVLETSVGALLAPDIRSEEEELTFPRQGYRIGTMPFADSKAFREMLEVPDNKLSRADVGVLSWAPSTYVDGVPQWKSWPTVLMTDPLSETLTNRGWRHVDEFLEAHPEANEIPWSEFLDYVRDHPNARREVPMQ